MASLVTAALVITTILIGFVAISLAQGNGGTEDGALRDHVCITVDRGDSLADDDFTKDGPVLRATERETVCRPQAWFDHPRVVQALVDARPVPVLLAVLACLIGLRHVIESTRDDGPFSSEAARRLARLRWWAAGFVLAGVTGSWVLRGVANDVVADASWSDYGTVWPAIATFIGVTIAGMICESGASQRMTAYARGRASVTDPPQPEGAQRPPGNPRDR
jgi:hypothetical protein